MGLPLRADDNHVLRGMFPLEQLHSLHAGMRFQMSLQKPEGCPLIMRGLKWSVVVAGRLWQYSHMPFNNRKGFRGSPSGRLLLLMLGSFCLSVAEGSESCLHTSYMIVEYLLRIILY